MCCERDCKRQRVEENIYMDLTADEELPPTPIRIDSPDTNVFEGIDIPQLFVDSLEYDSDTESDVSELTQEMEEMHVSRRLIEDDHAYIRGGLLPFSSIMNYRVRYDIVMDELKNPSFYRALQGMMGGAYHYVEVRQVFAYGINHGFFKISHENKVIERK